MLLLLYDIIVYLCVVDILNNLRFHSYVYMEHSCWSFLYIYENTIF